MVIIDAYPLGNRIVHGGRVWEMDGELVVETPAAKWAYSIELPLYRETLCEDHGLRLRFRVDVDAGSLGVGILNREGLAFRREIQAEIGSSEFECTIGPVRSIGSFIIRNAFGDDAPSRGRYRLLAAEARPDLPSSYAEFGEDLILFNTLKAVDHGFYIDVGAMDEERASVTKLFYEKGWSGINIEPCARWFNTLASRRPRDINLCLAVSDRSGTVILHEFADTGLSTTVDKYSNQYVMDGLPHRDYSVPCRSLADICAEYVRGDIHFLKIDVEGAEKSVLQGCDFGRFRPWLLAIESTVPGTHTPCYQDWEYLVLGAEYDFVLSYGINRYYIARERTDLKAFMKYPEPSQMMIKRVATKTTHFRVNAERTG